MFFLWLPLVVQWTENILSCPIDKSHSVPLILPEGMKMHYRAEIVVGDRGHFWSSLAYLGQVLSFLSGCICISGLMHKSLSYLLPNLKLFFVYDQ